jgi:hypothetical protein
MTTVQSMLARWRAAGLIALTLAAGALAPTGCASNDDALISPVVLQSPYLTTRGEVLIAVAPPTNESGVSGVDVLVVGDELVAAVSEAKGLSAVPMNRTLAAMTAKSLSGIRSPRDARVLADALGVDGVIVSSITAYDPYDPPKLGLSLALYMRDAETASQLDPKALSAAYTEPISNRTTYPDRPAATVVEHLDAANHEVLIELKEFAKGRHDPKSALTWRRYTASMDLYTQFAAYHSVRRLLQQEQVRLGTLAAASSEGKEQK